MHKTPARLQVANPANRSIETRRTGSAQFRGFCRPAILLGVTGLAFISTAANADCTANGLVVTCTGASTGFSSLSSGLSLSADSTATITGPVLLGNQANVTNAGSMTSSTTAPILEVGTNSAITNSGTITLTNTSSGAAAVQMGDNGIFTNNGSLSASAGAPVIQFGQAGTFINNGSATSAVTGNIQFGPNVSGGTSTLQNLNTAFGITGSIFSTGNTSIYNNGLINGSIVQTPTGGAVSLTNDTAGTFTGAISTGDTTSLTNNGIMSLTGTSNIGSARLGVGSFTNNGTLNVGTTGISEVVINGAFVNGSSSVLNISLHSNGASAPVAGTSFSQVYAAGAGGTATLGGTLNLQPASGFYPSGSTYNVILADQSIGGSFAAVNGSTLPFISFVPVGIITVGTQQAYEVMAVRTTTYANAIASVATPSQLVIAQALQPLVVTANADPTSTAATLVGDLDLLTVPQMQTLLDQVNPAGYLPYAQALTDQMNLFNRKVWLRTLDPKNDQDPLSFWGDISDQLHIGKVSADDNKEGIFAVTGGVDLSAPHWRVGVAASFSSATLRNAAVTLTGHNTSYVFGGYAGFDAGPVAVTGQVDYALGSISTTKTLSLVYTTTTTAATSTTSATTTSAPTNTSVTASPGDHLLKASGTLGFDVKAGGLKVTPFAGLDYARGAINGFTETGGDAADLTVSSIKIDRTDILGGVDITLGEEDLALNGDLGILRPYVRAAYRSQLGGGHSPTVSAFFNGDPSTSFTVDGVEAGRHEVDVDAGLSLDYTDGSLFLGYQGTIRNKMSDHGVQAGIRIAF